MDRFPMMSLIDITFHNSSPITTIISMENIILSGCGGGYDIFGCIPFYLKYQSNRNIHLTLINFSFTQRNLLINFGQELTEILFRIDPNKTGNLSDEIYFPELRLANELETSIYAIRCDYNQTTIELIVQAYNYLIQGRVIDEIILIDCGSDILLKGNEQQLGTPVEDISHARAIHLLSSNEVKRKSIVVIGTNIDTAHGILQSDIDARLNDLSKSIIFQWLWNYDDDENIRRYVEIVCRCNPQHTIVHSLVCAALQGHRGFYLPEHLRSRIRKSIVELREDTCLASGFHLDDVMKDNVYFHQLTLEMNLNEVQQTIYPNKKRLNSIRKNDRNSRLSHLLQCIFPFKH